MAKPKRRQQQHLRQEASRKRSYTTGSTAPKEIYKPGFPMNLLGNLKFFSIVGLGITAVMVFAAVLTRNNDPTQNAVEVPTTTAEASVDANASPSPTATPNPKQFDKAEQVIDATKNTYAATIKTDKGDIVLKLLADQAPKTVNTFVFLAEKHYFDGITFHRVIPNFVIQAGDPTGTGTGGPGFQTEEDQNDLKNTRGMVSMAKAGAVTEFGSQFFINLKDNPALDEDSSNQKRFYPWAEVTSGMDVADAISKVPADGAGKPTTPVTIQSVTIKTTPK